MRTLIISDVHANLTALDAVLRDAAPFDRVWCLGDVVGYGPDPNECIERIASLPVLTCIKGNHDVAILGEIDVQTFNYEARASLEWLASVLEAENLRWIGSLSELEEGNGVTLAHGSPRNPVWEYIMDRETARRNMSAFDSEVCLVGHTHIPCVFGMENGSDELPALFVMTPGEPFIIDQKSIINPGSVGQPRDNDPRASYMIYEPEQGLWCNYRVAYDYKKVQKRILTAGLPTRHALRLAEGW